MVAFSDQTILDSFDRVTKFVFNSEGNFDIKELENNLDKDLLSGLSDMLDDIAKRNITIVTTDTELDAFNSRVFEKIQQYPQYQLPFREVINVTLISKILKNIQYTNKNINETLLKNVYKENHTDDLLYIWLSAFRKKLSE